MHVMTWNLRDLGVIFSNLLLEITFQDEKVQKHPSIEGSALERKILYTLLL